MFRAGREDMALDVLTNVPVVLACNAIRLMANVFVHQDIVEKTAKNLARQGRSALAAKEYASATTMQRAIQLPGLVVA